MDFRNYCAGMGSAADDQKDAAQGYFSRGLVIDENVLKPLEQYLENNFEMVPLTSVFS